MGHIAHLSQLNPYLKIFATYSHVKILSPIVASPYPWRPWILQTSIYQEAAVNMNFSGTVVLKNKIYKHSPYICISMQNFDPLLWPHKTLGGPWI